MSCVVVAPRSAKYVAAAFRRPCDVQRIGSPAFVADFTKPVAEASRAEWLPAGHFSIFKEIADLIVTLIRGGAPVGPSFIPDGSVGIQWGKHWLDGDLDGQFGTRIKYEHEYPPNFPQSASNPQHVWCYPDASLPEFRRWAREHYVPNCLPGYLGGKEKQGLLPPSFTQLAIAAIQARKDIPKITR